MVILVLEICVDKKINVYMCVAREYTRRLSEIIICLNFNKTRKNDAVLIMIQNHNFTYPYLRGFEFYNHFYINL